MRRFLIFGFLLVLCVLGSYEILSIWWGLYLYQIHPEKEKLIQAIQTNPSDPDPYYRLGLIHLWDIKEVDLNKSKNFFLKAIEKNPFEQQYWLNLAKVLRRLGEEEALEKVLEKAIYLFPTGYLGRWTTANLLIERGKLDKAFVHLSYLLEHYPNKSIQIYDLLFRVIPESEKILEQVVPKDPSSFQYFLNYLHYIGDVKGAKKIWWRKDLFGWIPDRRDTLRHIEFLISQQALREAYNVWKERLIKEGIPMPSDGNLITNPGFEFKEILGGGFDWKMERVSGAEISFDNNTFYKGKSALKIVFNGKENLDFRHLYQYVAWKPGTEYLFKAQLKSQDLTTKSGIKIEIVGIKEQFSLSSEMLVGSNDWKEIRLSFRTPKASEGGIIRLRRERTEKFDRFISGTVWIDEVSLKERVP